jgi:alpha-mannosidase
MHQKNMRPRPKRWQLCLLLCFLCHGVILGQTRRPRSETARPQKSSDAGTAPATASSTHPNLAKEPILYAVAYAHLDTEWRWEYPQVIQEYLPKTMRNNFALFEKYPHYIFNFTGANRYRMMKEYYPADFERLRQYVAAGAGFRRALRWKKAT